jgi:GNAT superfamily N-acetyltransferase
VPLLAFISLVIFGARLGVLPALVAVPVVVLQLVLVVLLSRLAVTVFGQVARSRIGSAVVGVLVAGLLILSQSGWMLAVAVRTSGLLSTGVTPAFATLVRALPSGWGLYAVEAAGRSDWLTAVGVLAGLAAAIALLLLAWSWKLGSPRAARATIRGARRLRLVTRRCALRRRDLYVYLRLTGFSRLGTSAALSHVNAARTAPAGSDSGARRVPRLAHRSDRVVTAAEEEPMTGTGPLIRPMTPADRSALADFPNRVSAGSAIFRFHGSVTVLTDKTLDLLLDLADGQREAIIAVDDRGIAGVARFARDDLDPATAEVAILVADEWQHRGLARQLLRPLAGRARSAGIERFRAEIQADNTIARRFFLGLTPTTRERHNNGDVVVLINVAELLRMLE